MVEILNRQWHVKKSHTWLCNQHCACWTVLLRRCMENRVIMTLILISYGKVLLWKITFAYCDQRRWKLLWQFYHLLHFSKTVNCHFACWTCLSFFRRTIDIHGIARIHLLYETSCFIGTLFPILWMWFIFQTGRLNVLYSHFQTVQSAVAYGKEAFLGSDGMEGVLMKYAETVVKHLQIETSGWLPGPSHTNINWLRRWISNTSRVLDGM